MVIMFSPAWPDCVRWTQASSWVLAGLHVELGMVRVESWPS